MVLRKSDLLSSVGTMFEMFKAVINEVLGMGGSDEDMRRILKNPDLPHKIAEMIIAFNFFIVDNFEIEVDYSKTLADMISAGNLSLTDKMYVRTISRF